MNLVQQEIQEILKKHLSPLMAESIFVLSLSKSNADFRNFGPIEHKRFMQELEIGIRLYISDPVHQNDCISRISQILRRYSRYYFEQRFSV